MQLLLTFVLKHRLYFDHRKLEEARVLYVKFTVAELHLLKQGHFDLFRTFLLSIV